MIKFFSKIRQKILAENKYGKYLIYAIGEIVLVVIGILIALSINNWNENQKREKLKSAYRISLVNDLSLDTLMLSTLISENNNVLKVLRNQQDRFLGPYTSFDTLLNIVKNEFDPELNMRVKYNRNTINTLIASGNIDLFSREFNEMLMTLISLKDIERESSNFYSEVYSDKVSRFSDDYPVSGRQNSNLFDLVWLDIEQKKLASRFISLTDIKGFAHYSFLNEIKNVKEETSRILKQIENHN